MEALDKAGRAFPVEVSLSPLHTEEGTRVMAVARDITTRKETEQSMRKNEALYRLIAHHIPNGSVLVVDKDLRYRLADGPSLRASGSGPLEGLTPWETLPAELAEQRAAAYRAALAGTPTTSEMTVEGRTYRQQTVPLPEDDGTIEEVCFHGDGCAISKAAASMMTEQVTGLEVEAAEGLVERRGGL